MDIKLEELYLAYRKAKTDVFHENFQPMAIEFSRYERHLERELTALHDALQSEDWLGSQLFTGGVVWIPKPLKKSQAGTAASSNPAIYNNGMADWHNRKSEFKPKIEFKPICKVSVPTHILSALWINKVGHLLDYHLSKNVYSSRLRRTGANRRYNNWSSGSFKFYPAEYRKWRQRGIAVMRNTINEKQPVAAITLDFSDFFGSIDPSFITQPDFLSLLSNLTNDRLSLTEDEVAFTARYISTTSTLLSGPRSVGLPIGLAASSVIANILLFEFDTQIEQAIAPRYYGRYMDDLFLVLDNSRFKKNQPSDILDEIIAGFNKNNSSTPRLARDGDSIVLILDEDKYGKTALSFNGNKQRSFFIDPSSGTDVLDAIEEKLDAISSERRLLPVRALTDGAAAKSLSFSSGSTDGELDHLRHTDRVTIRRYGLSVILKAMHLYARMFPKATWADDREWLLQFSISHVLPPHRILELAKYIPHTLAIMVGAGDWTAAREIAYRVRRSIQGELVDLAADDPEKDKLRDFYDFLARWLLEAAICALPRRQSSTDKLSFPLRQHDREHLIRLAQKLFPEDDPSNILPEDIGEVICDLAWFDLAYHGSAWLFDVSADHSRLPLVCQRSENSPRASQAAFDGLASILTESDYATGMRVLLGDQCPPNFMMFPTRRITQIDICKIVPGAARNTKEWKLVNKSVRGVSWGRTGSNRWNADDSDPNVIFIGSPNDGKGAITAVTSIKCRNQDWARAASRDANASIERFDALAKLANSIISSKPLPHYVLFPELSVPREFADTLGSYFLSHGISAIIGTEYWIEDTSEGADSETTVHNDVHVYLLDNRLGYPANVLFVESKGRAAFHEGEDLRRLNNAKYPPSNGRTPTVFSHGEVAFSVLICSELTNIKYRSDLRGKIDILFVPSWNKDLVTFSALIESTSVDLHCFVALANNRTYGDSRVRGPYADSWRRDAVRVRGGLEDYFAACSLPIGDLRSFQDFYVPPSDGDPGFKPLPEGYAVASWRKRRAWKSVKG